MVMASSFHTLIAGSGPGTGRAIALQFAQTYPVVLISRRPETHRDVVSEIKAAGGTAIGLSADVTDPKQVSAAFNAVKQALPGSQLAVAVYNVSGGYVKKPFLELKKQDLEDSLNVAIRGFFEFSQRAIPLLLEAVPYCPRPPSLLVTGATSSLKGSSGFSTFTAGKAGLQALAQSLSREFGPQGVHVAHAIIDGVINKERFKHVNVNDSALDGKIQPEVIAKAYWFLHTQPKSAFTQELDLRPGVEKF